MSYQYTLKELKECLGAELYGDPECVITSVMPLQEAKEGEISFLDNPRYIKYLKNTKASAVILQKKYLTDCPTNALMLDNPYLGFAKITKLFEKSREINKGMHSTVILGSFCQIHPSANIGPYSVIGSNVVIQENASIGANCVIGDQVHIGKRSYLYPNVTLYSCTYIGQETIIHSGAVIGSDGFGFAKDKCFWHKISSLGKTRIGNNVEIGANTTIDRGTLCDTVIENGVKLDNQIQIGHNVYIDENTVIAGCVGIAGSTHIGKNCLIGGAVCIAGHLKIADGVVVSATSSLTKSINKAAHYSSVVPAQRYKVWYKNLARIRRFDKLSKKLEEILERMKENLGQKNRK